MWVNVRSRDLRVGHHVLCCPVREISLRVRAIWKQTDHIVFTRPGWQMCWGIPIRGLILGSLLIELTMTLEDRRTS